MFLYPVHRYFPLFFFTLLVAACSHHQESSEEENWHVIGDTIIIPASSNIHSKLKTEKITYFPFRRTIQSPAIIEGNPTKMAKMATPLSGRILKIHVAIGDKVKAGDPLFSIDAPEFVEAQKTYLSAVHTSNMSEINLKRQKDLLANGVGIQKDLEEAQRDNSIAKSELQNAVSKLKLYGIDIATLQIGEPLTIKAPVSGRVSAIEMTPGQFKSDLSEILMVVADLSEVWITANVKEKDIQYLYPGDDATAQVAAYPGKVYKGKILFMDDILNEETHSLKVRVQMPNPDRELKPGMFASVTFIDTPENSIMIPAKALLQKEDKSFVYIEIAPNKYRKQVVETAESQNGKILITAGLKIGETIVVDGGFYLLELR
jgi:cobalt-zinc-cadmium efflux system membrane fusion protein